MPLYKYIFSSPIFPFESLFFFILNTLPFSNTSNGAESSVIIFSILQTAIANGLNAKLYLKTLIDRVKPDSTDAELEMLLPWKIKL